MLEAIRKHVSGLLAKILIGLLIVSFAVWGIGDMIRGYGADVVASVGDKQIQTNEFRQAYQLQLDNISRQFGRRLTPQQAKAFGIEQQVLSRLIGAAAVDNHGLSLNLDISDRTVEKSVFTDPMFRGLDGSFSPSRLEDVLRQTGYSERHFFESRRRDTIRSQITDSMLSNVVPPKALRDMVRTFQGEQRVVDYIELTPANAVKLGTPTPDDLKKTYEGNKRRFVTPEYRKFQALLLTSAAAKAKLEITDAELKTAYEADKSMFAIPEQRRVQQISFKDEIAATAAKNKLSAGEKFIDIAKQTGAKQSDIDLGLVTKQALIDPKIAEAAFKLDKDQVSDVVKGRFTTVLLRVTEIKEGKIRAFDDVKGDIRKQIENERVGDKIQELQNNIDDNRLAGKSLKEISEILKLPFLDIAASDRQGNDKEGKPVITSADKDLLIRTAFGAEVGVENEVIELSNDGFAWLNLIAVTPEKQKLMKDVTDDIKKVWQEIETRRQLRETAAKLAKRVNDGTDMAVIATELNTKVKTTPAFKRGDSVPDFPPGATNRAFAMTLNSAGEANGSNAETRLLLRITKVLPAEKQTDAEANTLKEQLARQMQADVVAQYVAELQKHQSVSINQAVVDQTTGASALNPQ